MGRRVSTAVENFQRARNSLVAVFIMRPNMVGPGKFFKTSFQTAGERYFEFGFCKESTIRPAMVGPEKIFPNKDYLKALKRYFQIGI